MIDYVHTTITHCPEQVGFDRSVYSEFFAVFPEFEKDLLYHILGGIRIVQEKIGIGAQLAVMRFEQPFKITYISRSDCFTLGFLIWLQRVGSG